MVTAEEMIWCGYCTPCRNGYPNHCQNLEEIGFTIPGSVCRVSVDRAKFVLEAQRDRRSVRLEGKACEAGSVVEPTTVAYNGIFIRAGGFRPGSLRGCLRRGPIGLASVALCNTSGAGIVVAFEVSPNRREIAKKLGADYVYDPREVVPSQVLMELSKGEGFDMMVEAAGTPAKTLPEMEKALAISGKIVQIGRAAERVPVYLERLQSIAARSLDRRDTAAMRSSRASFA